MAGHVGRTGPLQRPRIPCLRPRQHPGAEGQRDPFRARQRGWRGGDRHLAWWCDRQAWRPLAHLDGEGRPGPGRGDGRPAGSPGTVVGGDRERRHYPPRPRRTDPVQRGQRPAQQCRLRIVAGPRWQRVGGHRGGRGPLHRERTHACLSGRCGFAARAGVPGHAGRQRHTVRRHRARRLSPAGRTLRHAVAIAAGGRRAEPGQGRRRQPVGGNRQQRPGAPGQVRRGALHQRARPAEQPRGGVAAGPRGQRLGPVPMPGCCGSAMRRSVPGTATRD